VSGTLTVGAPGRGWLRVFDFDTKLPMAPTATSHDGFAPGSRISFDDLGFVATVGGELQLDPATSPVQVLTFGNLDFVIDRLGGILDYIAGHAGELNPDIGGQVLVHPWTAVEQPAFEGGALPRTHDVTTDSHAATHPRATSTFMGMAGYASTSVFDLLEDSAEGSSSEAEGPDVALAHRECYMDNIANDVSGGAVSGAPVGATGTLGNVVAPFARQTPNQLLAQRLQRAELLSACYAELEAERARLEHEEAELGLHVPPRPRGGQHDAAYDGEPRLYFARVTQNITAAAMILRTIPEPTDPEMQGQHRNARRLIEYAAVQQADSSTARAHDSTSSTYSHHDVQGGRGPLPHAPCAEPAATT
jgi:hypothetical protein